MPRNREITHNFAANGDYDVITQGEQQVSIQGDFGTGTLTHFPLTQHGVGVAEKTMIVVEDYSSIIQGNRFTLSGATSPDLNVTIIPVIPHRT